MAADQSTAPKAGRRAGWRGAALVCAALVVGAWLSAIAPSSRPQGDGVAVVNGRATAPVVSSQAEPAAPESRATTAVASDQSDVTPVIPADLAAVEGRSDRTAPPTSAGGGIRAPGDEYWPEDGTLRP